MIDRHGRQVPARASEDQAVKRFAENIDMDALRLFLDDQDAPKYQTLFGMMGDPAYQKCSFATLLRKAHITLQEIQGLYTDGMRHLGLLRMMNQLPALMEDVIEDARTIAVACSRCDGYGMVQKGENETRLCPVCNGDKVIRQIGDRHARDLVFESAKLTNQKGPAVAIQQNFMGDTRMENLLSRTRSIIFDKPTTIALQPSHDKEEGKP